MQDLHPQSNRSRPERGLDHAHDLPISLLGRNRRRPWPERVDDSRPATATNRQPWVAPFGGPGLNRAVTEALGCVSLLGAVVVIFALILALDPLLPPGSRVVWGGVTFITLGVSWAIYNRQRRVRAAQDAERSEGPGDRPNTKIRRYGGYAYDIAIEWFEADARVLVSRGYRPMLACWQPIQRDHPYRYFVLAAASALVRGRYLGQRGGALDVTYEVDADAHHTPPDVSAAVRRLRDAQTDEVIKLD